MKLSEVARDIHPAKTIPFWYMNLDRSVKRRKFQAVQSIRHNLILNRVTAHTPESPEFIAFQEALKHQNRRVVDALTYSGYRLIKAALSSDDTLFVIAEDDTSFDKRFRETLYMHFLSSDLDFDIVHLGSRGTRNLFGSKDAFYSPWPIYRKWRPGLALRPGAPVCFFCNRIGLEKLATAFETYLSSNAEWEPFDNILAELYVSSGSQIRPTILTQPLCKEARFPSDRESLEAVEHS